MKNIFYLFLALTIFSCSDDDNSTETFLERYNGTIWVIDEEYYNELYASINYMRLNNNLSSFFTRYDEYINDGQLVTYCNDSSDEGYTIITNSENALSVRAIRLEDGVEYVFSMSVSDGGNFLSVETDETVETYPRADITDIPCP